MGVQKIFIGIFSFIIVFLLTVGIVSPAIAAGGHLPTGWDKNINEHREEIGFQKPVTGDSVQMIKSLVFENFVPIIKYIFIGVSLIVFGMYSYYMVLGGLGEEEQITEQRKNFLFAAIGFTLIGIASQIVEVFDPAGNATNNDIISIQAAQSVTQVVINYVELALAAIAIAVIFYAAVQMITSNGDEDKANRGKNLLKYGFIGFVLVMLADPLVNNIFFPNSGLSDVGNQEAQNFIIQGLGVLKFVLTFFGAIILVAFIVAGFLFLTAMDNDDQIEKAKRALIWTAIGMVIIVISYSIVVFFIGQSS